MAIQPPVLTLYLDQSEVWAGGTLTLTAVISHSGPAAEEYVLSIRGVDPSWVTLRPPTLTVEPGGQATATIIVAPPADAGSVELVLTVRAFAQMSSVVVEATQVALLYGAMGEPPVRATAYATEPTGLAPRTLAALVGGFVLLALVVGVLVYFAVRSKGNSVASTACVARPVNVVDLYSDDVTTAVRISDPDLSNMRVLRTEPAETLSPLFSSLVSLSPDGSRLAYVTASNEALDDAHLWSLDVANPSQRQELASVPKGMWVVRPAWSADSKQIAFVRYNDQQAALGQSQLELWVAEVGSQPRKVASPAELRPDGFYGDVAQPLCWAQDNRSVIFSSVAPAASQGARSTGTTRPVATAPGGPRQVAVDVLTGSTEALPFVTTAATQSPANGAGSGVCGLPPFSQNDPAWRTTIMQSSGDAIGQYGCAITATAMVLNAYGAILTPPQLNACLGDRANQIGWANVAGCANGAVTGSNAFDFSWPSLDQTLAAGDPAIVGMVRGQTGMHFVVVTAGGGGDAGDYSVMDPFDGSTSKTLQTFITSGYNPRWIRSFAGTGQACPRLIGAQTPAADATGITPAPAGALLVPAQLLPIFTKVSSQTGVPRELLIAMARVNSGFTPRAVGPPNGGTSGTADARAIAMTSDTAGRTLHTMGLTVADTSGAADDRPLGMMQFPPSLYRTFSSNVDAATGRQLGDAGIWDPEASIWAAAFFLQSHGIAADPRAALNAFTTAGWYGDLVLQVAAQYRAGNIPDDNFYDPNGTNKPGTLAAPNPIGGPASPAAAAGGATPASGTPGITGGTTAPSGSVATGASGRTGIQWSIPDASIWRSDVRLDVVNANDIGNVVKFTLYTLSPSGATGAPSSIINQPTTARPVTPGAIIRDDGVYEAVLVTQQGNAVRVSRRKFTIDHTPPRLDVTVSTGAATPSPGTSGTSTSGSATSGAPSAAASTQSRPSTVGLTRLKIGASDGLSGVAAIEYQLDSGPWQLYFSDDSFKPELFVTAPGNHTVRMRATDLAGNVSTERSLDFAVSAQPRTAAGLPSTTSAPFVPTLLSPTPLTSLGTPSGTSAAASALAQGTPVPSATVPLSAIIATSPAGPAGAAAGAAPVAPGGAAGAGPIPVSGGSAAGAPGAPGSAAVVPSAPGASAGAPGSTSGSAAAGAGTVAVVSSPGAGTPGGTSGTPGASGTTSGTVTGTGTPATTVASATPSATPAPGVSIAPPACPDTLVGNTDTCSLVTVTNSGVAALTISKVEASGDFAISDWKSSCGSRISAAGSCQIVVTFKPSANGSLVGRLTVTDNSPDSPQSVPLSGRGIAQSTVVPTATPIPAPAIKIDQVTCPDTLLGTTQQCSLTTITNTSSLPVTISTPAISTKEFFLSSNQCVAALAPGAPCQIVISFTPVGNPGLHLATLSVAYSGGTGSPQTVPLHANEVAPVVSFSPSSLTCGPAAVGQKVTCVDAVTNTGTAPLTITNIQMPNGYSQDNACAITLNVGVTCQIKITFAPTAAAQYTGTLTLTDNASDSPQSLALTGSGVIPTVSVLPATVMCSNSITATGASPCSQPVIITNTGTVPLTITKTEITASAPATTNPFSIPPTACVGTVNPGANCQITISFKPSVAGANPGILKVTDDAADSPQPVAISGVVTTN